MAPACAACSPTVIACGVLPYESIDPHSDVVARCGTAFGADPLSLRQDYEREDAPAVEVTRSGPFTLLRTSRANSDGG